MEDALAEVLSRHTTLGASISGEHDSRVEIQVFLASEDFDLIPALVEDLATIGVDQPDVGTQEDEDWLAAYRDHIRPFVVGRRWWIDPHPEDPTSAPEGLRRLVIEPRMAFGTGSHQSTALVLMELEDRPPEGLNVLDVGTGSGILALAAERLGAAWAVGFDLDPEAVMVARQIRRDQDFPCDPAYFVGSRAALGRGVFDLVLCNMISEHFLPMAGSFLELMSPKAAVIFSGILESEEAEVVAALEDYGYRLRSKRVLDGWVALRMTHES